MKGQSKISRNSLTELVFTFLISCFSKEKCLPEIFLKSWQHKTDFGHCTQWHDILCKTELKDTATS